MNNPQITAMNNPFDYTPSPQMLAEQELLVAHINRLRSANELFRQETDRGKMFGILLTEKSEALWAFSGQIGGRYDWEGFVPAVFDYLAPDGYFKRHEAEISAINRQVEQLTNDADYSRLIAELNDLRSKAKDDVEAFQLMMKQARSLREQRRLEGGANEAELIRESQFQKAELRRKKQAWQRQIEETSAQIDAHEGEIRSLKLQRQRQSDALQSWLFRSFVLRNIRGEQRDLTAIFSAYSHRRGIRMSIPSGSGECCEPKLLQQAFALGHNPVEIGMFWWGASPVGEIRNHLQFYPACNGKCRPILSFMLCQDLGFRSQDSYSVGHDFIIFEDESFFVVNKPAGLLSVPGKDGAESVVSLLRKLRPECTEILPVHRLDMHTSGLLLVAKNSSAHRQLQSQFLCRSVKKEYVALLQNPLPSAPVLPQGTISLPLRPDYDDRPRQMVDFERGRRAVTHYRFLSPRSILLVPETGRTHQLRVHCAHPLGLNNPILGDPLYGTKSTRLHLHARSLSFLHPLTSAPLTFLAPQPWGV